MRFRKGSKVEILSKREVPSGSWTPAEIVSKKGDYYIVKCDYYFLYGCPQHLRVHRNNIRPCPPLLESLIGLVIGDIVEILENNSWKLAIMSYVLSEDCAKVKLTGCGRTLKLDKSNIRFRQSWRNNKWVLADKGSENLNAEANIYFEDPSPVALRRLKKSPGICPSNLETCATAGARRKERKRQSLSERLLPIIPGEYRQGTSNDELVHLIPETLKRGDSDNVASSAGSCSPRNNPTPNMDIDLDDAEVSSESRRGISETHRLELNAYRSVMVALHASGPLCWEREALLTNLRLMLHISSDEHLAELRRLNDYQK